MREWLLGLTLPVVLALVAPWGLAPGTAAAEQTSVRVAAEPAGGAVFPPPVPDPGPPGLLPLAPARPPAVAGIPEPCFARHPWPASASPARTRASMAAIFGLELTGAGWTDPRHRPLVKILWETLDGIACTPYLTRIRGKNGGMVRLHAGPTRSWAWGDYGLTRPGAVTLDFAKLATAHAAGDDGRIVRLVVHELAHVLQKDRGTNPALVRSFQQVYAREGRFSDYGRGSLETMAEVIGYYVARCAQDNPYDSGEHGAYYAWARTHVFGEVEFGPAPGRTPDCRGA